MRYLFSNSLRRKPYFSLIVILMSWGALIPSAFATPCLDVPQTANTERSAHKGYLSLNNGSTTNYSCTCYLNGNDKTSPDAQFLSYSRTITSGRYFFFSSSCEDENGKKLSLDSELCIGSDTRARINSTYYLQNTTEPNEYFACSTNDIGKFIAYRVGLKKCDDGRFIDSNGDCAAPHVEPEFKVLPADAEQYTVSVTGNQTHIRSVSPNTGIDCKYGQGICSYVFNTNSTIDLEVVDIKRDVGLVLNDYSEFRLLRY